VKTSCPHVEKINETPGLLIFSFKKVLQGALQGQKSFSLTEKLKQFRRFKAFSFSVVKY